MLDVERELTALSPLCPPLPPPHPPWTTSPPALTKLHQHKLPYEVNGGYCGYSSSHGMFLELLENKTILQLSLNSDSSYTIARQLPWKDGIGSKYKYFTSSDCVVTRDHNSQTTFISPCDLSESSTFTKDYGYLRGEVVDIIYTHEITKLIVFMYIFYFGKYGKACICTQSIFFVLSRFVALDYNISPYMCIFFP